jgi:hypothetical protein
MTQLSALVQPARPDGVTGSSAGLRTPAAAVSFFSREAVRFAAVAIQLGLLVLVIRRFDFEGGQFGDVAVLAWFGFLIHHWLPARARLPFFALLSAVSVPLTVGFKIGAAVIIVGLIIIAICHMEWPFWARVLMLVCIGVGLMWLRPTPYGPPVVILASMFMLRVIVYLYDLKHRAAPISLVRASAYFFALPNVCFPLFPLIDYKTFCTTYFNDAPLAIYQRGLRWILRGLVHLLLYRVVYQFLAIDPQDPKQLVDLGSVAQFMVMTFLLYLRISGEFHLVIGMLHLFGFNLPETHHMYLLSTSFMDLWRRINIYWKDFILKIFFYPAYFRVKRLGPTWAMVLATIYAFFFTWVLHAYQLLWLRGGVAGGQEGETLGLLQRLWGWLSWVFSVFTWQDTVFWWLLGALVLASGLWEAKRGRQRALGQTQRTLWSELGRALRTIVVFVTLITLWTLWSLQSMEELGLLLAAARNVTVASVLAILAGLTGLGIAAIVFGHSGAERTEVSRGAKRTAGGSAFWPQTAIVLSGSVAFLLFAAAPHLHAIKDRAIGEVMTSLRQDRLSEMEMNALTRGYYEELDVTRHDVPIRLATQPKPWWPAQKLHRPTNNFFLHEPIPNVTVPVEGQGITFSSVSFNKWGMRGPAHDAEKGIGVFRIAVLGSSWEAGRGVADNENLCCLLEERLNREVRDGSIRRFEVWNFSVEGYGAPQKLMTLQQKVFALEPDLVLFVTYRRENERTGDTLSYVINFGYEPPPSLRRCLYGIYEKAQVQPGVTSRAQVERRIKPYTAEVVEEVFEQFAAECRAHQVPAAFVYRPEIKEFRWLGRAMREEVLAAAAKTGLPILDLSACFAGVEDKDSLMVMPETAYALKSMKREAVDDHPNALGHQLMAEELYKQLHTPEGRALLKARK